MALYEFDVPGQALTFALDQIDGLTRLSCACHEFARSCSSAVHVLRKRVSLLDRKNQKAVYWDCNGFERLQSCLDAFLSNRSTNALLTESTLSMHKLLRFVSEEQCFRGAFQHPDVSPLITVRFCGKDDTSSWLDVFSFVSKSGGMCLAVCESIGIDADRADYSEHNTFLHYMGSIVAVLGDLDYRGYMLWYDNASSLTKSVDSSFLFSEGRQQREWW